MEKIKNRIFTILSINIASEDNDVIFLLIDLNQLNKYFIWKLIILFI